MNDADAEAIEVLRRFLIECCDPPFCPDGEDRPPGRSHHIQNIDCMKLADRSPPLAQLLLTKTLTLMDWIKKVCLELCEKVGKHISEHDLSVRFSHLPSWSGPLPSVLPPEGQIVELCGSIVRMTTKKVVPHTYRLMCPKCRKLTEKYSNLFTRGETEVFKCPDAGCKGETLSIVGHEWMDFVECRLQQRSNQSGRLPKSIKVTLDDELGSKCSVGQFVEVIGILHKKWKHIYPLSRPSIELTVAAINIVPMEAYRGATLSASSAPRRTLGRNSTEGAKFTPESFFLSSTDKRERNATLSLSVSPQLAGLFAPRMSVLLSAVGGTNTAGKNGMHVRSTIHCLYVGDPSTGKTQLLKFAAAIAPRSTSTTGMGSTSAGLTVAASKEGGEWVLEPGALVLSDGGSCIIDELRTVAPADRASLHEAMEQQTISVAKGGIVAKLRTVCSVLSACNPPKKRGGKTEIGVGGPLLSRFDFIFLLWDIPQPEMDERIAKHILLYNTTQTDVTPTLSEENVARYLWWVRSQYANVEGPLLNDGAASLLAKYYEVQRQRGTSGAIGDGVPVTVRFLESLVRICQAHAKLHLQSTCTIEDAAMTIFLMERSAYSLKIPLYGLHEDLYTSSKRLDALFLSREPADLEIQSAVLREIVKVITHYGSFHANDSREDPLVLEPNEKPGSVLVRESVVDPAVIRSVKHLSQRVQTPSRSQVVYPASVERDRPANLYTVEPGGGERGVVEEEVAVLLPTTQSSGDQEGGSSPPVEGARMPSKKRLRSVEDIMQSLNFQSQ